VTPNSSIERKASGALRVPPVSAMKPAAGRALFFALLPLGMVVLSHVLFGDLSGVSRGGDGAASRFAVHTAFSGAVFLLSAVGAFVAFLLFRNRLPSHKAVFVTAQLFAIASFYAVFFAFTRGGLWAAGAWLLFGAFLFAAAAAALSRRHSG
jgi:hypothetical protein